MNSTLLKKYETIEQSKVSEKDKKVLEQVKKLSNNFEETDEAKNKVAEKILDQIIKINPDAIKKPQVVAQKVAKVQKVAKAKKVAQAKKTATTTPKKSDNNIMSVAKEIQKDGESWKDAMERAKQVLKERKEQVVQKQKTELEKLYALVKTKKELKGFANSDIRRDSVRDAKPRGARFVTKEGTTSNGYGTFPNKLGRKYWETRDRHADRLAPNYPKDMPKLASGGAVSDEKIWDLLHKEEKLNFITKNKSEIEKKIKLNQDIISKSIKNDNWDSLNEDIKNVFNKHIQNKKFYFENIGKEVTWEDFKGVKREGVIDDIDFNGNYVIANEFSSPSTLSPDEVNIKDKKRFWLFSNGGAVSDEKIWDLLHKEEKLNFITKNKSEIEKKIKLNQDIISKSIKNDNWDSLNEDIKNVFNKHIQNKKFYFENIGKKVTWEDFKGEKRKGVIDGIDFNGNYIIIEPDELYGGDTLSPDEVNIQDESKKKFWFFSDGGMNNLTMQNVSFEKGGIFYKEGSNKYGLGNTEIFIQEENDIYCVYDNVYNDENENWEIKKLTDFDDMDEAKEFAIEHSKKEYTDGGAVSNERMYNFLKDDLRQLEEAIKSGDMEEVNRFFSYWLGSSGHLKSLETKNNERMYNFLKEDLEKLTGAVEHNDTEEVERFFSYWGQHLESLKMANGGSLPFMTDPNFGNFQNTGAFAEGGGIGDLTEQEFLKKHFGTSVFTENPSQYFEIKKLSSSDDNKVNDFVKELKADGFTVKKRAYSDFTSVMGVKKKGSFELGGAFMMTDLAGHTGGSDGIGNPMPLSGVSGTHYTGLVGETGAMSSGELFEAGGAMMQNQQVINDASQSYANYYLGEGASQGVYKDGGSIPNNYEGRTAEYIWDNLSKQQRSHFLYDHIFEIEDYKKIEKLPSSQIIKAYNSEWSSLDNDIKNRFSNHVRGGQYAYGGKTKSRPSMRELYIEQIASLTNTRKVGVDTFANEHNLTDSELSNLITGIGRGMISRSDFVTAVTGSEGNAIQKEVIAFAKSDKAYKMADGGSVDDSVIDELWNGYASAVLFTETDYDSGEPLDSEYSVSDFDEDTESSTKKMLAKFYLENKDAIEESELDLDTIGNDVWYTRSGQGAGFFDHSLDAEVEEKLTKGAKALGEYPSVETYDGKISVRGGRAFAKGGFVGTVEFNVGDTVWQKDEKRYATVMNNYGDPINGDGGEVRLDTTGNTPIFTYDKKTYENTGYNLVKVGEKGDTGKFTPKVLDEMKESANRLIDSRKESKDKEGVAYYQKVYKRLLDGEFDSMTGAKATSSQKSISNETTYVPNRDVKELSVVVKGELKQLKGSDIVDGVYVKNSAKSSSKVDANAVFAKILKDAKEAKQGKSKRFDASDLKKINLEMVQKLAEAGYSEQQIRNVILGYAFDNEIVAENELEYDKGVFSYEESYVKEKIDDLVDAQKNKEFSVGIEYPNFDWKSIVKKYKITLKPKDVVVKKTMGDGSRYDYYYEVFVGENIVLGHNYGYKNFDKNGKLKDDYLEKGKKVSDPTKQNSWQKERGQKAGFNGGYWYVVSSKIETIDDVLKTLLSQEDGYCKELELYSDSFAKTLKENNVEFADGGLLSSNEIDKLDSGFTISQLDDMLRKMFPYSFGVDVFKAGKNLFDYNLDDKIKDDKLKLYFYDKSSNRELNYEVHQGQENTYFDFMLFDEEMNTYIGTFGFKDRGDVDKSYITKFVSFLHDAYHYPFQVRHSVMANGGFMSDVYANGGGVSDYMNSPEYKEMFNKMQKLTLDVKSRVVRAVGLDSAIEFYDSDYPVRPYQLLERAVRSGFITLDDINERVVDSAMETAQDSEDDEEVGSSDFTSYLHNFLDEAGFKVGYVNGKLTREFADGGSMNGSGEVNVKKRNFDVIIMPKKLEIEVQITRADTVDQYGLNDAEVEWHQERWGYIIKADDNKKFNKALRVLGITQKYADGGMFGDNEGFMKADNNRNFRYSEKEVYVETIDEPIDLTDYTEDRTNEVDIRTIDNDIDLTDDRKVKARLTQPKRGNGEKFLAIAPNAFEFMGENIPMPSSNKHKND